jgi:hypothetical protein
MTIDDVRRTVVKIESVSDDDERAHGMEDGLHQDVLRAIALGATDPAGLARAALETQNIKFARWCA